MDKFPMLNLYKTIFFGLGWIIIVGGLWVAIKASEGTGFQQGDAFSDMRLFFAFFGASVFFGGIMIITAELITVVVSIEDHLHSMRYLEEKRDQISKQSNQSVSPSATSYSSSSSSSYSSSPKSGSMASKLGSFDPPSG